MNRLPKLLAALVIAAAPVLILAVDGRAAPAAAQARRQWRRGDTLPIETLRAGPDVNYAAQRLRRPPEGYGWFAVDGAFLLASLSSGLILDVAE
jgi:Ni/Co efflux regulator RcnB